MGNSIVPASADSGNQSVSPFERIKHIDEQRNEYWLARELMFELDYSQWRNFNSVIQKAQIACWKSGNQSARHFADISKKVNLGDGVQKEISDYQLSRFACYLIAQNGDSSKTVIANAQTYFAMQTRRQELADTPKTELQILEQMVAVFAQQQRQIDELRELQAGTAQAVEALSDKVADAEYFTVKHYCKAQGIKYTVTILQRWGHDAAKLSRAQGVPIHAVSDREWEVVNSYRMDILAQVCVAKPKPPSQNTLPGVN